MHDVLRVCLVGPSIRRTGGQSVVAGQLVESLNASKSLRVDFLEIDPQLWRPLRFLQRIRFVRTIVTSLLYISTLIWRLRRYDVVHVMSASYWSFAIATAPAIRVARIFRVPVVLNYHSGEAEDHFLTWPSAANLSRKVAPAIVPSAYLSEVFKKFQIPTRIVPNFVNTMTFQYRYREHCEPKFVTNRSFEAHYNVSAVLHAFARIQDVFPAASLNIAGDGPLRSDLENTAKTLGIRHYRFLGAVSQSEMAELYACADIYLNASRIDNMPMSLLEAAAAGLPIVSSDAGGIPRMMQDQENALLVPVDDVEALAEAGLRLLQDHELSRAIATNAHRLVVDKYGPERVVQQWEQQYRACSADKK